MVQLKPYPGRQAQSALLAACATSQAATAERPRAVDAPRPVRRAGIGAEVTRDLRAADRPVSPSTVLLAIALAAAPQEQIDLSARFEADFGAIDARFDSLAAQTASAADKFVSERHCYGLLKLGALEELIEDLSDDVCYVLGVFAAESADVGAMVDAELAVAL